MSVEDEAAELVQRLADKRGGVVTAAEVRRMAQRYADLAHALEVIAGRVVDSDRRG